MRESDLQKCPKNCVYLVIHARADHARTDVNGFDSISRCSLIIVETFGTIECTHLLIQAGSADNAADRNN